MQKIKCSSGYRLVIITVQKRGGGEENNVHSLGTKTELYGRNDFQCSTAW